MLLAHSKYNTYQLVAQELWQRKQTSPLVFALGIGSFTAVIPGHPVDKHYSRPCLNYIVCTTTATIPRPIIDDHHR